MVLIKAVQMLSILFEFPWSQMKHRFKLLIKPFSFARVVEILGGHRLRPPPDRRKMAVLYITAVKTELMVRLRRNRSQFCEMA